MNKKFVLPAFIVLLSITNSGIYLFRQSVLFTQAPFKSFVKPVCELPGITAIH